MIVDDLQTFDRGHIKIIRSMKRFAGAIRGAGQDLVGSDVVDNSRVGGRGSGTT